MDKHPRYKRSTEKTSLENRCGHDVGKGKVGRIGGIALTDIYYHVLK